MFQMGLGSYQVSGTCSRTVCVDGAWSCCRCLCFDGGVTCDLCVDGKKVGSGLVGHAKLVLKTDLAAKRRSELRVAVPTGLKSGVGV